MTKLLLAVALFAITLNTANAFEGLVTSVKDGDTLTVINESGVPEKIRLYRVDSPEMKYGNVPYQPYATEARTGLLNLCGGEIATITRKGTSYSRTVANVQCRGVDAGKHQVINGNAWVYRYKQTKYFNKLQEDAKTRKIGLWADPAVEPYLWRKQAREINS